MFWLGFWIVVAGYFVVGFTRLPTYFEMFREDKYNSDTEAFWMGFCLVFIWPYYEAGKWLKDKAINHLTREEREQEEFEKAQRIVKEYAERKEREEREKFDRELKG